MANVFDFDVFVDVDGVVADFVGRMAELHDVDLVEMYSDPSSKGKLMDELIGISDKEFWAPAIGVDFWVDLEKTSEADKIMDLILSRFGIENVNFLTTSSKDHDSLKGKGIWIEKHFPKMARRFFTGGGKKSSVAHPRSILFDDMERNVEPFCQKGGLGILVPRIWNRNHGLESQMLNYLELMIPTGV